LCCTVESGGPDLIVRFLSKVILKKCVKYLANPRKMLNIVCAIFASKLMNLNFLTLAQWISPRIPLPQINKIILNKTYVILSPDFPTIEGKSIALIGPGFLGSKTKILNQYEIIARIGFTGPGSSGSELNERCDISFLAKWHAENLSNQILMKGLAKETRLLLREDVSAESRKILNEKFTTSIFETKMGSELFGRVTPNFAPQCILWILSQKPKELHISHLDLMLDKRRPRNYASNKDLVTINGVNYHSEKTIKRSFEQFHNPFTHFYFFRSLRDKAEITYSVHLNTIIEDGISKFRERIYKEYYT
jgi:hypothetical protein